MNNGGRPGHKSKTARLYVSFVGKIMQKFPRESRRDEVIKALRGYLAWTTVSRILLYVTTFCWRRLSPPYEQ